MSGPKDHSTLIAELHHLSGEFTTHPYGDKRSLKALGFNPNQERVSSVVLKEETALELGAPGLLSVSRAFITRDPSIVRDRLHVVELSPHRTGSESLSLLHVAVLHFPDTMDINDQGPVRLMNLTNRLPRVMTRSIPGRLWVRVHKKLIKKFSLYGWGQVIRAAYEAHYPQVDKIDLFLAAGDDALIGRFAPLAGAAGVIAGENRKLRWEQDGVIACNDLDCAVCDEQVACDTIRQVVTFRRRNP